MLDGYSKTIDERLQSYLDAIANDEMDCLYFDSFKMLTRNMEKLFYAMNLTLTSDAVFFTANCYIANGYVERRAPCLPPMSSVDDHLSKARQRQLLDDRISERYRNAIRSLIDSI